MRTSQVITKSEEQAYIAWANENDVIIDGAEGISNGELVGRYFRETWPNDITLENLTQAWEALRPHLKFRIYEPYQKELAACGENRLVT